MMGTERSKFAIGGLVLGAVVLLAVNLFSHTSLKGLRLDLTQDRLYTISEGTRSVLGSLEEPLTARLYFSRILGERSPRHALYYDRIRELLERYVAIADGQMRLELYDPEPFSEAEDRAVAAGLQGVPVTAAGEQGYFGLTLATSTDLEAVVPFFAMERENFIEYDLTKMIHTLTNPERQTIGLISPLPVDGRPAEGPIPPQRRWVIMDQVREYFNVEVVSGDASVIPENIQTLMVVHPRGLTQGAIYAVDQFVLRGGKALVFVDSAAEMERLGSPVLALESQDDLAFNRVLEAWGVRLLTDKVAADLDSARRVSFDSDPKRPQVIDYVAWLALGKANFDADDIITADIERVHLASSGVLEAVEGGETRVATLLETGPRSMMIDAESVRGDEPDVAALYRDFKPGDKPLMLAARITGPAGTAYPEGAPVGSSGEKTFDGEHISRSLSDINVIVVADADMLHDLFWVSVREMFGQKVLVPLADNGTFVVNAIDALAGSDALIGLRGRGRTDRPFVLVDNIRREAERRFRAKEEELQKKLNDLQTQMARIQRKGEGEGEAMITVEDRQTIANFRGEMVAVRKELRNVQHDLRRDIENLQAWLKFLNVAGLPLLLGLGSLGWWMWRRSHRRRIAGPGGRA